MSELFIYVITGFAKMFVQSETYWYFMDCMKLFFEA